MMDMRNSVRRERGGAILQLIFSVVVLTVAGAIAFFLIVIKEDVETAPTVNKGPLVQAIDAEARDVPVTIAGYGTVEASVEVAVIPQVGGRVEDVHDQLVRGGVIPAGEAILQIEKKDYELAEQRIQAEIDRLQASIEALAATRKARAAEVARAETALETEQAEAEVAIEEWKKLNPDRPAPTLLAREPQLRERRATVAAAEANVEEIESTVKQLQAQKREAATRLEQAVLDTRRTTVSLPYSVRVMSESVDVGQYVSRGQSVANVYRTDSLQVPVPLEDRHLQWFAIGENVEGPGAGVTLRASFGGQVREWVGRATRTEGQIDPQTRMVTVIVTVDDATARGAEESGAAVALTPGMFVEAEIKGRTLENVTPLPRYAVHDGREVWLFVETSPQTQLGRLWDYFWPSNSGKLVTRSVTLAREEQETVYIASGLPDEARVITTLMDVVTDGMKVRLLDDAAPDADPDEPAIEVGDAAAAVDREM